MLPKQKFMFCLCSFFSFYVLCLCPIYSLELHRTVFVAFVHVTCCKFLFVCFFFVFFFFSSWRGESVMFCKAKVGNCELATVNM